MKSKWYGSFVQTGVSCTDRIVQGEKKQNDECAVWSKQRTLRSSPDLRGFLFSRLLKNRRTSLMLTGASRGSVRTVGVDCVARDEK
jgi:hypothetical protein